jgi:hypothetical protein
MEDVFLKQVMMVMQTKFATAGIRARRTSEVVRATLAAPLSHPRYKKNSDIRDQMLKKPLQQPAYPLPSFSPWTKTPSPSPL